MAIGDIALVTALQLYHSGAARKGRRPPAWPVTLGLQAVLVYAFVFPFAHVSVGTLAPFLAGSVLLLVPGWWRWAGYAAVVASWPALYSALGLLGNGIPGGQQVPTALYLAVEIAGVGLMVYRLSRSSSAIRRDSSVVVPGRTPPSISACRTHVRNASG